MKTTLKTRKKNRNHFGNLSCFQSAEICLRTFFIIIFNIYIQVIYFILLL